MSKTLTEQEVLKKLKIDDFRHLTKDKVISMANMLHKMDPEVAKKALEQFPQFSNTVKEMLSDLKNTLDKSLESNTESVQVYYNTCNSIIETLQRQLENNNLQFEERKYIIDRMLEVQKTMGEKDSENKKFIAALAALGTTALGLAALVLASALGSNTSIGDGDL